MLLFNCNNVPHVIPLGRKGNRTGREKQYLTNNNLTQKLSFYMKILGIFSLLLKSSFICFMLIGFSQGKSLCQTTTFTVYAFSLEALLIFRIKKSCVQGCLSSKEKEFSLLSCGFSPLWWSKDTILQIWCNLSPFWKIANKIFSTPVLEIDPGIATYLARTLVSGKYTA